MNKRIFALIVVAGGKGLRMGTELPKQFLEINGKPVLHYTLEAFLGFSQEKFDLITYLVLPKEHEDYWNKISTNWKYKKQVQIIFGGKERFFSVQNAIKQIEKADIVAVHDGVRPVLEADFLERIFKVNCQKIGKVPVVPLVDSIREYQEDGSTISVERKNYCAVQTPQIFPFKILREAYTQEFSNQFTDDASVVEAMGHQVDTFEGSINNKKVTHPKDLKIIKELL
ncbi:MAG: 2-C-methyl-D-erythritol 4-phosphate cytidylyltransferase [Flavobacteriales bacterium]|jgi:2-C-methyl-D-erythritol 4-phosphate cytidylyltransferase|nr:2-C-methyl-D-erythritol 4-phosphate cytidylyltransferase [Flavobacteriales bacterium]